jgi:hypothetical protein
MVDLLASVLFLAIGCLITEVACAVLGYAVGKQKGQGALGLVLGVFLGPFGILIAALLQDNRPRHRKFKDTGAYYRSRDAGHSFSHYQHQKNTADWLKNLN